MKIYIAGCITDNPDYKEQFKQAEERLKAQGHTVINPAWKPHGLTYKQYIDLGLMELMQCEAVYLLRGWEKSNGASLEAQYAITAELKVMEEG